MLKRRHTNGDPGRRGMRLLPGLADIFRWPFERAAWAIERGVLWPLRERFAGRSPAGRSVGAAALVAIAAAAALTGILVLADDGDAPREQVAAPTRVAIATPEAQPQSEKPRGPVLHGTTPDFSVDKGAVVSAATGKQADTNGSAGPATAAGTGAGASQPEEGAAATTSSAKPVPAGPAAMKVARRFSEAFVFYEIGERPARAKTVFGETATAQLAGALGERPPRLPADAKVPKARVVNLVPGPRAGKAYTVSVSLLRVGLTSELRLELNKKNGQWLVTDVRG
ncbi:MAG TPA: hypothetical protein VF085_01255 [Solirubrobacterales bacterium]